VKNVEGMTGMVKVSSGFDDGTPMPNCTAQNDRVFLAKSSRAGPASVGRATWEGGGFQLEKSDY
jgi:hypothetical protein